jgi:virginiamycin B lyase
LTPNFRIDQLSGAEVEQLLPDNKQTRLIESECIRCHALTNPAKSAGMTASAWQLFLPRMTLKRHWDNPYSGGKFMGSGTPPTDYDDRLSDLSEGLEKYFGPNSLYFSPNSEPPKLDQIKHPPLTEAALKATVHEFDIPTRDVGAHSIMTDSEGNAWFSEIQESGNKIGEFIWRTQTFKEYPLPLPDLRPHTGVIGKDGLVWYPLTAHGIHEKLISLDPRTGKMVMYDFPGNPTIPHTTTLDHDGNIWMSGTGLLKFDVKTHKFAQYQLPIPTGTDYSENVWQSWHNLPGKPALPIDPTIYDVKVDSKGMVWCSIESVGILIRLDPKTGHTKTFVPPDTTSIKGIAIDGDDNIWFAEFWGSYLGKYDQKADKFTIYRPPTPFAMPYGITIDTKNGYVWIADLNGNHMSRLDPKTGNFDEIPFPTAQASARFPGWDPTSGRVWFTEALADKIGYVELDSEVK